MIQMSLYDPCILWGLRFSAATYGLRVTNDAVTETLTFPSSGSLSPTTDYYVSNDGSATDLIKMLADTLVSHSTITTATITFDTDFRLSITGTGISSLVLLWSHANTTLDATIFGFVAGLDYADEDPPAPSPNTIKGIWRPKRPVSDDGRNQRIHVGGIATTLSGLSRVSSLMAPSLVPRERTMLWRNLVQSEVLDEYSEATDPFGALEYAWWQSMSLGRAYRYYENELATASPIYDVLAISSLARPYTRAGDWAIRWDVSIPSNVITSGTYTNAYSWIGDGTNDYVACTDTTTTDSLAACSWHLWFRVPTAWPSGTSDVILSKWATNNQQWAIIAHTTSGTIRVSTPTSLTTDSAYWTAGSALFAIDTWYMLDVVFDGAAAGNARLKIYKNGVDVSSSGTYTGSIPATLAGNGTAQINIGANGSGQYFAGYLDEVAIWSSALSAAQVANLYVTGHPADLVTANASVPPPMHWWRLEGNYLDSGTSVTKAHGTASGSPVFSTTVIP